jgi:hypothetical protein
MTEKPSSLASVMLARDAAPSQSVRERVAADDILFAKGAATAAGFNPHYRSFEYQAAPRPPTFDAADPPPTFDAAERPPAPQPGVQPFQAAVIAFGCMALLLSAALYVGSRSAGPRVVAHAPAPAMVAPPPLSAAAIPQAVEALPVEPPRIAAAPVETPAAKPPAAPGTDDLVARGTELLATGDIAAARLFFERAAEAGDGHAALLVGITLDPAFLAQVGVRGMRGDAAAAATWYRRARELGEPDAQRCIDSLAARGIDSGVTQP